MRHNWDITATIDTCTVCLLERRTTADLRNVLGLYGNKRHVYFVDGMWKKPSETDAGKLCPGKPTYQSPKTNI